MPRPPRRHATRRRGNGRNGAEDYPGAKRVGVSHEALTAGDPCPSGNGLPFNRLAGLQENLGMPLPSSTQLDIVAEASSLIQPAYDELIRQAAQGHVLHNDDTTVTILELMGERAKPAAASAQDASGQPDRPVSGARQVSLLHGLNLLTVPSPITLCRSDRLACFLDRTYRRNRSEEPVPPT